MHFQDQPRYCSQVRLPKPQTFLISQDLDYVFLCCWSTQKYSVLFEANTLKISRLIFSFHPCAQLISTPLNSLSTHSVIMTLMLCLQPLDLVFIPDVLIWIQGSPKDSDPDYHFELLYVFLLWEGSSNQFFTQLHPTPKTGAPCKAVGYSLGSFILFAWVSQMSGDDWFLRNKIRRSYNLKT